MGHINCSANMTSLPHSYFISMLDWETDDTSLLFRCSRCSKRCSASVQHHVTKPRGLHSRHTIISSLRHAWSYIMFLTFPRPIHTFGIRAPFPLSFLPSFLCAESTWAGRSFYFKSCHGIFCTRQPSINIPHSLFSSTLTGWQEERVCGLWLISTVLLGTFSNIDVKPCFP